MGNQSNFECAAEPHLYSPRGWSLGALRVRPELHADQRPTHVLPGGPIPKPRRVQGSHGDLRLRPGSLRAEYPLTGCGAIRA